MASKKRRKRRGQVLNLLEAVDELGSEVNAILNEEREREYFYALLLNYSFIENSLKHICFLEAAWSLSDLPKIPRSILETLAKTYLDVTFNKAIDNAFRGKFTRSETLKRKLRSLLRKRNSLVHQLWLQHEARRNPSLLRQELEEAVDISNALVQSLTRLQKKIGVLDLYDPTVWLRETDFFSFEASD